MRFGQQYLHGKTLHLFMMQGCLCVSVRLVLEIKITVIHFLVTQNLYFVGRGAKHTKLEENKRKFKETLPSASLVLAAAAQAFRIESSCRL